MNSPIGARRVKTDLLTDNVISHTHFATRACSNPPPPSHTVVRNKNTENAIYRLTFEISISQNLIVYVLFFCYFRSQLPARATRLLNRSRFQQSQLSNTGSDSPKSLDGLHRRTPTRPASQFGRESNSSPDDNNLMLDKSMHNSMIQDVLYFKKQLIRLRSILQEVIISVTF